MGRSLIASKMGVMLAEEALIDLGFTKTFLAEKKLICSRSTVTSFFSRKPINHENFNKICSALKLQWRDIVEKDLASSKDHEQKDISTVSVSEHKKSESKQTYQETILTKKQVRLAFEIAGNIDQINKEKLTDIIKLLRKIADDDSIEIFTTQNDISKLILILTGSLFGLIRIQTLYRLKILIEIRGMLILNVGFENLCGDDIDSYLYRDIEGVDLSGADLCGANFIGRSLMNANFSGADLCGAKFSGAYFRNVNLSNANLSNTDFTEAELNEVNFSNANLSKADFTGTNLNEADCNGADFSEAIFSRTIFIPRSNMDIPSTIETILSGAIVKSAVFCFSQEIQGNARHDLISRGAIFYD